MGIILFFVMAFRNNQSVQAYQSGLRSFFAFKASLRSFVNVLLNRVPRDVVPARVRARAVGLAVAFPYAVVMDLRESPSFGEGAVSGALSTADIAMVESAPSAALQVLEMLTALMHNDVIPAVSVPVGNGLQGALSSLYAPYGETERIKQSPCTLSYVTHLRVLLVAYLVTLPLALVEQMGLAAIPVAWVVCYALMSLEMLAVDVENPFDGQGKSDLRLLAHCRLVKETILESWQRWTENMQKKMDATADAQLYVNVPAACSTLMAG